MRTSDNSTPESEQKSGLVTADIRGEMGGEPKNVSKGNGECDLNTVLEMYHYTNGTVLELNGFLEDAIREYQEAISLNPGEGFYHYNLGVALLKNNEYNEAYKALNEAIHLNPDDYESRCALGDVFCAIGRSLLDEGKCREAVESFREAVAIDHEYPDYHTGLGQALLDVVRASRDGNNEELLSSAISEFQIALGIDPENKAARVNLGVALSISRSESQRTEGMRLLSEALIADPFNDDVRSCIDALADTSLHMA